MGVANVPISLSYTGAFGVTKGSSTEDVGAMGLRTENAGEDSYIKDAGVEDVATGSNMAVVGVTAGSRVRRSRMFELAMEISGASESSIEYFGAARSNVAISGASESRTGSNSEGMDV